MTRGGAATPEPFDLSEISRSGDLLDGLAARRIPDVADPAARLLAALVADVDAGAPPLPASPPRAACTAKPGRPVVRAFVTFGAATLMLTTAGAAVAGGGTEHGHKADGPAVEKLDVSEGSKADVGARAVPADRRTAPSPADGRTGEPPAALARDRRHDGPAARHRPSAVSPASPRPWGDHGGRGADPISHGPFGPAPAPSAPAVSDPPQSPPAAPPTPPGPEGEDHSTTRGSGSRHAHGPPADAAVGRTARPGVMARSDAADGSARGDGAV